MGKLERKLAKKQQKNKEEKSAQEMEPLKMRMKSQMEAEQYAEAIDTMAELANLKCMDPEIMYEGAFCYFMLGDYERAAKWIDNTLTFAPSHMMARVLLARLCLLEERTEDGLAIFDFILENYSADMAADVQTEIEEILEYYGRNEADKLCRCYPHIAAFLQLEEPVPEAAPLEEMAQPPVQPVAAEAVVPAEEPAASVEASLTKAQEAAAALKNLMRRTRENNGGQVQPQVQNEAAEPVPAVSSARDEILQGQYSLAEKVRLLDAAAGRAFAANQLGEAQACLQAALDMDSCDSDILRNMAVLALAQNQRTAALDYAQRMAVPDFVLLDKLREQ